MTIIIKNAKEINLPDWTQQDIEALINDGLLPAGSTPDTVVLASDNNTPKTTIMASGFLVGRGTAGDGEFEEITLGTNLSLTGTTLNATGGGGGGSNIYNTSDVITNNHAREVGIYGVNTSLTFKAKNSSGDTDPQVSLRFTNDDPMVDLTASNGSGEYIRFYTSGANGYIQDTKGTPVGLEYVADYSATFTNRSLVDKEYVDSMVGAVSSVTASDQTVEVSPTTGAVLITAHLPYIFNYMFMGS